MLGRRGDGKVELREFAREEDVGEFAVGLALHSCVEGVGAVSLVSLEAVRRG